MHPAELVLLAFAAICLVPMTAISAIVHARPGWRTPTYDRDIAWAQGLPTAGLVAQVLLPAIGWAWAVPGLLAVVISACAWVVWGTAVRILRLARAKVSAPQIAPAVRAEGHAMRAGFADVLERFPIGVYVD
jgi:hypothetical protein